LCTISCNSKKAKTTLANVTIENTGIFSYGTVDAITHAEQRGAASKTEKGKELEK